MHWSKNKENRFVKLYKNSSDEEVAKIMKLNLSFVKKKAEELGLQKHKDNKKIWATEEIGFLKKHYSNTHNTLLSQQLCIPKMELEHFAYRLGLRKNINNWKDYLVYDEESGLLEKWNEEYNGNKNSCSRGHYILGKILKHLFPYYKITDEEPIGNLRIDWYIPQLKIAFEFDGEQHLKYNQFFFNTKQDFNNAQNNDYAKSEMCESMGIALVHIYYDEPLTISLVKFKIEQVV